MNGVVLAQPAKASFVTEGVQAWSRDGFKAEWSPLISALSVADFNGDGRADALLQGQSAGDASYLLYGKAKGAIFGAAQAFEAGQLPPAERYQLLPGAYSGKAASLYAQARLPTGSNYLATLSGTSTVKVITTLADAALAFDAGSTASGDALATPESGGMALALLAANTAGRTPGQFAVSPMGAATYQIPIWTPPGARGLEPQLALVYTSGSPDGVMGPGWNLAGLSAIARCNKTYADNAGAPAAVTLTTGASGDDFCLDGNRMRVTSGTYGAAGSVYQTMVATFSRITAYGTAGNGPSYFYVEGKDGLIYEYGNTADSKAYANGGSTPYAWMLNKVRDRQGNNLKVVYSTTSGAVQPSSIQYTQTPSTNGSTYPYTVAFTYQNRVTNLSKYVAGGNVQETKVLTKINVQSSGTSVRQYLFTYATAPTTQRDRLVSIQECAGSAGTECLKATTVSYQNGVAGIANPATGTGATGVVRGSIRAADIDGDGREDLLFATLSGSNYLWWVQFATASGFSAAVNTGAVTTTLTGVLLDDFLGEGKNSVLAPNGSIFYQYRWNGSSFSATSTGLSVVASVSYASADVDGDGHPDLAYIATYGGTVYLVKNTTAVSVLSFSSTAIAAYQGGGSYPYVLHGLAGNNSFPSSSVRHMDFDGDGRDDLVYTYIYVNILNGGTLMSVGLLSRGNSFVAGPTLGQKSGGTVAPVSWNDDACTDLQNGFDVKIAACSGSYSTTITLPAMPSLFLDWDGDGRTDALVNPGGTWQLYRSLGTGVAAAVSTGIPVGPGDTVPLDQNGDGLSDLAVMGTGNVINYGLHNGASTPPDLATTITDGWGVTASPTYVPITQSNYTKYTTAVFPEMDFQGAAYVVSQASQSDGIGGSFSNTFQYYGARIHRQGRGFEGFAKTRAVDLRNNLVHEVLYNQSFPYTGTVDEDTVYKSDGTSVITRTTNDYQVKTLNDPADTTGSKCKLAVLAIDTRCFPYLSHVDSSNYEITSGSPIVQSTTADYTPDAWGNQTNATTTTTDKDPTSPEYNKSWTSTIANTTITNDTTNWS